MSTSGSSTPTTTAISGARLTNEDGTLLTDLTTYLSKADACKSQPSPVVCLEAADRTLGRQIHDYANKLAGGGSFGAKAADVTAPERRPDAGEQLEILGDASRPGQLRPGPQHLQRERRHHVVSESRGRRPRSESQLSRRRAQEAPTVTVKFLVTSMPGVITTFLAGEVD